jgi:hypothetical protein
VRCRIFDPVSTQESEAVNIFILGIDHKVTKEIGNFTQGAILRQRQEFEKLLNRLVDKRKVEFIGEEEYPERPTIARRIAKSLTGVRCESIEMSKQERHARGIQEEQNNRPRCPETRVPSDEIREKFMVQRTIALARDAHSVLILCGRLHTESLANKFLKAGHHVETGDLGNYDWYSESTCPEGET